MNKKVEGLTPEQISRRKFLKVAGITAAGAALTAGCAKAPVATPEPVTCPPCEKPEPVKESWMPGAWDYEADVVIVGFGIAGARAAMVAADAGSNVIIIDKAPDGEEGGSSGLFAGYLKFERPAIEEKKITFGTVDDEYLKRIEEGELKLKDYFVALNNENILVDAAPPYTIVNGGGYVLWGIIREDVEKRSNIQIMYETPGKRLIQNPVTKEVLGVVAESGGKEIILKGKKAVIMATGSYSGNLSMMNNFNEAGVFIANNGSPHNTGDGHYMCMAAGAKQWHYSMGIEFYNWGFKAPSEEIGHAICITNYSPSSNYIFVDKFGKRFMNEFTMMAHEKSQMPVLDFYGNYVTPSMDRDYPHVPFFMIFDEAKRLAGNINEGTASGSFGASGSRAIGWNNVHRVYEWSSDNSAEIEKGWIVKADTLEELATKIKGKDAWGNEFSVDPAGLVETVAQYNADVAAGVDPFGRPVDNLAPIGEGPYYAIELCPDAIYTLGGPKNNYFGQTLDITENPIPRLYNAGDLGSFGVVTPGAYLGAMVVGGFAGEHAVGLEPWDAA